MSGNHILLCDANPRAHTHDIITHTWVVTCVTLGWKGLRPPVPTSYRRQHPWWLADVRMAKRSEAFFLVNNSWSISAEAHTQQDP